MRSPLHTSSQHQLSFSFFLPKSTLTSYTLWFSKPIRPSSQSNYFKSYLPISYHTNHFINIHSTHSLTITQHSYPSHNIHTQLSCVTDIHITRERIHNLTSFKSLVNIQICIRWQNWINKRSVHCSFTSSLHLRSLGLMDRYSWQSLPVFHSTKGIIIPTS